MNTSINTINMISEYLQTPNSIYKDYLYEKIAKDEQLLNVLKAQESVINLTSSFEIPVMPTSCVNLIKPSLKKYYDFTKALQIGSITSVVIIGGILGYNIFFNNQPTVSVPSKIEITEPKQAPQIKQSKNIFEMQKSNVSLLSFANTVNEKISNKSTGFSGDLTKYKAIDSQTSLSGSLLDKAASEVSGGVVDVEKVDNYLHRASIDQHDVKIIENTDEVVRREKR